jgi:hypothetical protein
VSQTTQTSNNCSEFTIVTLKTARSIEHWIIVDLATLLVWMTMAFFSGRHFRGEKTYKTQHFWISKGLNGVVVALPTLPAFALILLNFVDFHGQMATIIIEIVSFSPYPAACIQVVHPHHLSWEQEALLVLE